MIKHGILSRRKNGHTDAQGSLIFRFYVEVKRSHGDPLSASMAIVEMCSTSLLPALDLSRVKKLNSIPFSFRALEAAYQSSMVRSLQSITCPGPRTLLAFVLNCDRMFHPTVGLLLELSQLLRSQETPQVSTPVAKEKVSSGIKMILSKQSVKRADVRKAMDKSSSRLDASSHRHDHLR